MSGKTEETAPRSAGAAQVGPAGRGALHAGASEGVVLEAAGGRYRVLQDSGDRVTAFLRGRVKREKRTGDRIVAGDRVEVSPADEEDGWVIESVTERRSELVRAGPRGRRPRVVAANLECVFVVMSTAEPPFEHTTVDRFLVLAESCRIDPVLVINKTDLEDGSPAAAAGAVMYRTIGYPVVQCSAATGAGLDTLVAAMRGRLCALVGPSGVGKSSLLNALDPSLDLRTRAVGRRGKRGRHTTVGARLLVLGDDLRVIDTPGFSDVTAWGIEPEEMDANFPEFREFTGSCRFRRCTHVHEPECAVLEALKAGAVFRERYASYRALLEE